VERGDGQRSGHRPQRQIRRLPEDLPGGVREPAVCARGLPVQRFAADHGRHDLDGEVTPPDAGGLGDQPAVGQPQRGREVERPGRHVGHPAQHPDRRAQVTAGRVRDLLLPPGRLDVSGGGVDHRLDAVHPAAEQAPARQHHGDGGAGRLRRGPARMPAVAPDLGDPQIRSHEQRPHGQHRSTVARSWCPVAA
jgi:hypothetical protein